jgi:hypothetical protein
MVSTRACPIGSRVEDNRGDDRLLDLRAGDAEDPFWCVEPCLARSRRRPENDDVRNGRDGFAEPLKHPPATPRRLHVFLPYLCFSRPRLGPGRHTRRLGQKAGRKQVRRTRPKTGGAGLRLHEPRRPHRRDGSLPHDQGQSHLAVHYLERRSARLEDAALLFGELVRQRKIPANYSGLRGLLRGAVSEKSDYGYKSASVGREAAARWLLETEPFLAAVREIPG